MFLPHRSLVEEIEVEERTTVRTSGIRRHTDEKAVRRHREDRRYRRAALARRA